VFHPIVIAFETLSLLLIALLIVPGQLRDRPQTAIIASTPVENRVLPSISPTTTVLPTPSHTKQVRAVAQQKLNEPPKLDQFPSPTPLSEQEQLVVAFSHYASPDQQQSIAETKIEPDKPLEIADVSIQLLNPDIQP
jgi:hypothetical protein